jgi:carbonic anhydrase
MLKRTFLVGLFLCCTVAQAAPRWTYDQDYTGQEEWGVFYPLCDAGTMQSPVQIGSTKPSFRPPLDFAYTASKAEIKFVDRTVSVEIKGKNYLKDHGKRYDLKAIRFHSPSEHMVRDKYYLAEIQLIHESKDKKSLILSVFTADGGNPPQLTELLQHANAAEGTEITVDPSWLIPEKRDYYAYTGSLTHPPCTEGIEWRILKEPLGISRAQLGMISALVGRNARLPQPLYMRTVEETGR